MGWESKKADFERNKGRGTSTYGIIELINNKKSILDEEIGRILSVGDLSITWTSPIPPDYNEYYDKDFLSELGVRKLTDEKYPLDQFWPKRGPQWDALGYGNGKGFIVEAKSHISELFRDINTSNPESSEFIKKSLDEVKGKITPFADKRYEGDWTKVFYQYANRLAHLYYLRVLNELDIYLVYVYFLNDPYWGINAVSSKEKWEGVISTVKNYLGFGDHPHGLSDYVIDVFVDYNELL